MKNSSILARSLLFAFLLGSLILQSGCNGRISNPFSLHIDLTKVDAVFAAEPIIATEEGTHPLNYRQDRSSVVLYTYDENLYFSVYHADDSTPELKGYVCFFDEDTANVVESYRLSYDRPFFWDGAVYYTEGNPRNAQWYSYRLDLTSEEIVQYPHGISMREAASRHLFHFGNDAQLYFIDQRSEGTGFPINGSEQGESTRIPVDYTINDMTYTDGFLPYDSLRCTDAQGNSKTLDFAEGIERITPYQDGLLVENYTNGNALHYIDAEGNILELFHLPADRAVGAVNFHGDDVFLSVQRYQTEGAGGIYEPWEDDTESGTYRIDMRDYSVEKISDVAYNGLYIFNSTTIYATDRSANVYVLDFDGNVLQTLIQIGK